MSTMEEYIYFESKINTSKTMMQLLVQTNKGTDWFLEEKWYSDCDDMIQEITLKKNDYFERRFFVELEVFPMPHNDEDKLIRMIKGYSSNLKFKLKRKEYDTFKYDPRRFQSNSGNSEYEFGVHGYKIILSPIMELVQAPAVRCKRKRNKGVFIGGLKRLSTDISTLLTTDSKQDTVVNCSGSKIKAHRSILAVRSSWFKANFLGLKYEESELGKFLGAENISSKFLKEGLDKTIQYLSSLQNRLPNHVFSDSNATIQRARQQRKITKQERKKQRKKERRASKKGHKKMQKTTDNSTWGNVDAAVHDSKTNGGSITEENGEKELNVVSIPKVENDTNNFPLDTSVFETNSEVEKNGENINSKTAADEIECKNTSDDLRNIDDFGSCSTTYEQGNLVMELIPKIPRLIKNISSSDGYLVDENMKTVFKDFMDFLYTGMYTIKDLDKALILYICADMYGVPDLKYKCSSHIKESISTKTVIGIFYFACFFRVNDIFDKCKEFLSNEEIKPIIKSECRQELKEIFMEFPGKEKDLKGYEILDGDESSNAQVYESAEDSQFIQEEGRDSEQTSNTPNSENHLVGNEIPDGGESSNAQVNEGAKNLQFMQEEGSDSEQSPHENGIPDGSESLNAQVNENAEDSQFMQEEGSDSEQTSNILNSENHLIGNEIPDGGEPSNAYVNENVEGSQFLQEAGRDSEQTSNIPNAETEAGANS